MSVLRKEKPSPFTDQDQNQDPLRRDASSNPERISQNRNEDWNGPDKINTDRINSDRSDAPADPAPRRPPQSVAAPVTQNAGNAGSPVTDDTYDGEIISSPADPVAQSGTAAGVAQPRTASRVQSEIPRDASRESGPIFDDEALRDFRSRWDQVQTSFVDEPRHAVEQADALVGAVVKRIADQFADERGKLEKQWGSGQNVSTEDLRQNFQRYRAFFDRLLAF